MSYRELGSARVLKRYDPDEFLKPVKRKIPTATVSQGWQSIDQVASSLLRELQGGALKA